MRTVIMDAEQIRRTVIRLAHEIDERCNGLDGVAFVGVKRGGEAVARRICDVFRQSESRTVPCGGIDIGMTRDDLVSAFFVPDARQNELDFDLTDKTVILVDDVLHTGRSAVAGIEALFRLGRPKAIRFLALIDRGGRELPVLADFIGKTVPTSHAEYVDVQLSGAGDFNDSISIIRRDS